MDKHHNNQATISGLVEGLLPEDAMDKEAQMSKEALERIRHKTLSKAGFAGQDAPQKHDGGTQKARRMRWPLRVLIAAAVLCGLFTTALAATDIGFYLEDRFGDDFAFLTQLRTLTTGGSEISAQAVDQGITASMEAAYSNDSGAMLLLSLTDQENRLSGEVSLRGHFTKGGYGSYSSQTTIKKDDETGQVFALIDILSGDQLASRATGYEITEIVLYSEYRQAVPTGILASDLARWEDLATHGEDAQAPVSAQDGAPQPTRAYGGEEHFSVPVQVVPGLVLTDIYCSAEGLIIEGRYTQQDDADVRYSSFGFVLLGPDGEMVDYDFGSNAFLTEENGEVERIMSGFRQFTDLSQLDGYTIGVSFSEESGFIQGSWELKFRMPREGAIRTIPIHQELSAQDLVVNVEKVVVTRNTVLVYAKRLAKADPLAINNVFDQFERRDEIELNLYRGDDPLSSRMLGVFSSDYYRDDMKAILSYDGDLTDAELRITNALTGDILYALPLDRE